MRSLLQRTVPFGQPLVTGGITFALALGVDLTSKVLAIAWDTNGKVVVYNDRPGMLVLRVLMTLIAICVTYLLTRGAQRLEIGRLWGAWIGVGLLAGGVIGNGVSSLIWSRGVPDFIHTPAYVWNLADFEISIGVTGGILSVVVAALSAFVRERRLPPPAHELD
jgi:Signal peptidase (SPase) II